MKVVTNTTNVVFHKNVSNASLFPYIIIVHAMQWIVKLHPTYLHKL
jgi:hypothetical protein